VSRLRPPLLRRLGEENGMALVLALAVMITLTIGTISVIGYSMSNENTARRVSKTQVAFNLAESGIANGVGIISNPANQTSLATSTLLPAPGATGLLFHYGTGDAYLWGSLSIITCPTTCTLKKGVWHLTATGNVSWHHEGRVDIVKRTVHLDVPFGWDPLQPANTDAWKYIYSKNTSGTSLSLANCDETIFNNTTIEAGMYVTGNLCMNTPSEIQGVPGGSPAVNLIVKGWVEQDSNAKIGKTQPVTSVELGGGCSNAFAALQTNVTLCKKNSYEITPGAVNTTTVIPPPVADFAGWYYFSSPGPNAPCSVINTGTPPVFDNNTTLDKDLTTQGSITSGVVDLAPSTTDYDCKAADGSELKWVRGNPGVLTLNGTIYIDGSVTATSTPIDFNGEGAVYVSGTFLIKNATFCAILNSQKNGCDATAWLNATTPDILVVAAYGHGTGGSNPWDQVANGDSVEIKSSNFQGALYGAQTVEVDTTSNAQGPMVAGKEIISQHGGSPFPQFAYVPFGTPGNTITKYLSQAPQYWSGG